uniref:Biotin carboxyl carrier protein of acetyl-CoA carboxylase n=1 Tax=Vertebrata thuyoides TaxID=2006970 RepID=A0A1Z1MAZ9_9FLOR|nr:acetyl-CoA carboxylase biotin carboxyl carrier protein [Vertebrata thuyoides]ARW63140.1 acetyl-CoA carboxylase biotin carboxyl carrier protein [Vertebrata thuyoides]
MNKTKNIKKFINSITKNNIDKIAINKDKTKILINRKKVHKIELQTHKRPEESRSNSAKLAKRSSIINNEKQINKVNNINEIQKVSTLYSTIVSPMVGTFYKSPAPNENPFIEIGETIKPKQVVCIIEAMKLMNEIESEIKGEVVEILVKDGDIVDCGQALLKVKIK